ncbi:MAG: hypothetical protein K1X53_04315 [Candidatus Sumerlaeaceae bacterium]|nr:hypothetical protein [Candidatus Sumerlaeaceae bacterium]
MKQHFFKFKFRPAFLIAIAFSLAAGSATAQVTLPHKESFNYPPNTLLTSGSANWTANSGAGSNPVTINAGSLAYTGLPGIADNRTSSSHGSGSREDVGLDFTPAPADGSSVFCSAIVQVTTATGAGDYHLHFGSAGAASSDFRARVFVKPGTAVNTFNLGIQFGSSGVTYDATDRPCGTPVFVVFSYDRVVGATNDTVRLWINPTLGLGTAPAPNLTVAYITGELTAPGRVSIRQGTGLTATLETDELRIGLNWTDVAPNNAGIENWQKQ